MSTNGLPGRVIEGLITGGFLTEEQAAAAIEVAQTRDVTYGTVLTEWDLVRPADVRLLLEQEFGIASVDLSSYAPDAGALARIPAEAARRWQVLPLFELDGVLTVAIADPMDVFILNAVSRQAGLDIEPVLAAKASLRAALGQYYPESAAEAPAEAGMVAAGVAPAAARASSRSGVRSAEAASPTAVGVGTQVPDLSVLGTGDPASASALVARILEDAVAKGASRIHLLSYKGEFILAYRIKGALERVGQGPLARQAFLVDAFCRAAGVTPPADGAPVVARTRLRVLDADLTITLSCVETLGGYRLVASFTAPRTDPHSLEDLGLLEAEARALKAMVERGRGILLVCAPAANGAAATYYALVAHAVAAGRTVFSVEESCEYELPGAAQVPVRAPGATVDALLCAALQQDVDVVGIDALHTAGDVEAAVAIAAAGRLVIATYAAGDIAAGVRRMLDLGVEPHGLAAALSLGVGQRLVRLNCPNCSGETDGMLAARIPGAEAGLRDRAGSGCPNCGGTGHRGAVAIHEVLPFTEPVRAVISRCGSVTDISRAAHAAGMRPLVTAGLARVREGQVSAEELNRVLHFAG